MKKIIFLVVLFGWIAAIMWPTISTGFQWRPVLVMSALVLFMGVWGLHDVFPAVDWEDKFDYFMSLTAISFISSMCAFLVPCLYDIDTGLKWNTWCEIMVDVFLASAFIGLMLIYIYQRKNMRFWKYLVLVLALIVLSALIACLFG